MGTILLGRQGSGPWSATSDLPPSHTTLVKEGADGGQRSDQTLGSAPLMMKG
jgi:hypothetical protein